MPDTNAIHTKDRNAAITRHWEKSANLPKYFRFDVILCTCCFLRSCNSFKRCVKDKAQQAETWSIANKRHQDITNDSTAAFNACRKDTHPVHFHASSKISQFYMSMFVEQHVVRLHIPAPESTWVDNLTTENLTCTIATNLNSIFNVILDNTRFDVSVMHVFLIAAALLSHKKALGWNENAPVNITHGMYCFQGQHHLGSVKFGPSFRHIIIGHKVN